MTYSIIQKSQLEGAHRLDAEYYQPEYLELEKRLVNQPILEEVAEKIICGPFGSAILNSDYLDQGIPLLRVNDLNGDFINTENLVYIDDQLSLELKRYKVFPGDIVVSQRGTIAMFSLVTPDFKEYNISANLISILSSDKINFYYLIAFLNSKYGNSQLLRRLSGQVQPKITTDDVKNILVYLPEKKTQKIVSELVTKSKEELDNSKLSYSQAEVMLLEELGLRDFKEKEDLFSVVNFSDIKTKRRMDAEYYQPKYERVLTTIKKYDGKLLGELASIKKGFEPGGEAYQEEGKLFIRVSSLSKEGITDKDQKYLNEKLYQQLQKDYQPRIDEILLTKDATPGIAHVIKEPIEGIISGGVLRLKLKEDIEREYIALCINSIIGQSQVERDSGGSVIAHWKPEQVKNMIIPILSKSTQQKIADLVCQSHESRKKAKQLLEEAKHKVEELIEKGGN